MKSSLSTGTFTITYTVLCIFDFQNDFTFFIQPCSILFQFFSLFIHFPSILSYFNHYITFQVPNHQSIFFQSSFSWTSQLNMRPLALPFSSYFSCFFFSSISQQSFIYFSYQVYNLGSSNNSIFLYIFAIKCE